MKQSLKGEYIFVNIEKYLLKCAEDWEQKCCQFYAPISILCQSSGYGKTKIMFEIAKKYPTIFICLRKKKSGFPYRSSLANIFDTKMEKLDTACIFFLAALKCALDLISEINESFNNQNKTTEDIRNHIALEFGKTQPWLKKDEMDEFVFDNETLIDNQIQLINSNQERLFNEIIPKIRKECNDLTSQINSPLFFAFD
nr:uncharacterized protein LOC105846289 [Hydra vulgaris]